MKAIPYCTSATRNCTRLSVRSRSPHADFELGSERGDIPDLNDVCTLFGGEHMLRGISGYLVTETTDENPERVVTVQQLTCVYLQSALDPGDGSWAAGRAAFASSVELVGRIDGK